MELSVGLLFFVKRRIFMCNMAGYVGKLNAAPILIEMMKAEEGIQGGYQTGIATVSEGKIAYEKLTGDTDHLVANTPASSLLGNIGIMHSRSKCGKAGGREWAHPFVSERDGVIRNAYIANGGQGFFRKDKPKLERRAEELLALGYNMRSRDRFETSYPTLSDGTCVHMTDVMCQEIQYRIDSGMDTVEAMDSAFHYIPAELAGLLIVPEAPDYITFSRTNMPLYVGFSSHGGYIASTALAFPKDVKRIAMIPSFTSGRLYADRYELIPYKEEIGNMGQINDRRTAQAYDMIVGLLREGKKECRHLYTAVYKLFEGYDYFDAEPLTYNIMQTLAEEGRLGEEIVRVPGNEDGLTAPMNVYWLK